MSAVEPGVAAPSATNPCIRKQIRFSLPALTRFGLTEEAGKRSVFQAIFEASNAERLKQDKLCNGTCANPNEDCNQMIWRLGAADEEEEEGERAINCYPAEDKDHNLGYICTFGGGEVETACICSAKS